MDVCMYMCVCVCVCVCVYVYIYIYSPSPDGMCYRSEDLNLLVLAAHPVYWNTKRKRQLKIRVHTFFSN